MKSCIYQGRVRHRRLRPARHEFSYRLFMMYLDLDELPSLFRNRWLWANEKPALAAFHRRDHLGDSGVPLAEAVRQLVADETGIRPAGPIRLLTHLRYFGYCFNPVSFYFCYDPSDQGLETIVAEVSNTPWGERHCYVLDAAMNEARQNSRRRYRFDKVFHVSPFMDMDIRYDWRFVFPDKRIITHMDSYTRGTKLFDATMTLAPTPISRSSLARTLTQYPFMTGKVITAIHFQALRLWLKRIPFVPHPQMAMSNED